MKIIKEKFITSFDGYDGDVMYVNTKTLRNGDLGVEFNINKKSYFAFNKEMLSELIVVLQKARKKL